MRLDRQSTTVPKTSNVSALTLSMAMDRSLAREDFAAFEDCPELRARDVVEARAGRPDVARPDRAAQAQHFLAEREADPLLPLVADIGRVSVIHRGGAGDVAGAEQ